MILAGRRLNDNMGCYVISQVVKLMLQKRIHVNDSRILMMGLTFKENCPDLRNTRVTDMIEELNNFGAIVDVYDPWVDADEAQREYGITPVNNPEKGSYDAIILAVGHDKFKKMSVAEIHGYGKQKHVLYDIKYILPAGDVDGRL
jgi:UDP-N-acetyl-D-galactosamine dehydrogenase